jgi:hypothetical protein
MSNCDVVGLKKLDSVAGTRGKKKEDDLWRKTLWDLVYPLVIAYLK